MSLNKTIFEIVKESIMSTALNVKGYLDTLPSEIQDFLFQDLDRWIKITGYKGEDHFVYMYKTRQEFRSLLLYRARIAQRLFEIDNDIVAKITKLHKGAEHAWVKSLFISCGDIGPGFYIEHGFSTIIFAKSIGKNFHVNQNVTIGTGKGGHPTIADSVKVGANGVIIGDIYVPNGVTIGAGAVLNFDVPPGSTVVSQKARVLEANRR